MAADAQPVPDHPCGVGEAAARLQALVEEAERLAGDGDRVGMREVAVRIPKALNTGRALTGGHFQLTAEQRSVLDAAFDRAYPVTNRTDPADVLDTPRSSDSRRAYLSALVGHQWSRTAPARDSLMDAAVADRDIRLLRLLVVSPVGVLRRESVVRAFDTLDALGALDAPTVEHALTDDLSLGYALLGVSPTDKTVVAPPAESLPTVRPIFDDLTWRLLSDGVGWNGLPKVLRPTGLRFVLRALGGEHDQQVTAHIGAAELTDAERAVLVEHLRTGTDAKRQRAFALRRPAGDAAALLPMFGLADAAPLLDLIERTTSYQPVAYNRSAIVAAVEAAGVAATKQLLELVPSEIVAAVMGWNRAAVEKRVKSNALAGIAAFGMLPLADGESVLDRYLALREVAKRGPKLGPNRRHSHAAAIDTALHHLAQVGGFADAQRLEWDCEARIADAGADGWGMGDYSLIVSLDGDDPTITVSRAGKALKSVPAAVRRAPQYAAARSRQESLREQARRLRTGLVERLVATAGTLTPEEFVQLMTLPAGAAMLPALLWRDAADRIGLVDQVDITGPLTAVHPVLLHPGICYPVGRPSGPPAAAPTRKAGVSELYLLTPAGRAAGDASSRFAGHTVVGKVAAQLLSGRGSDRTR